MEFSKVQNRFINHKAVGYQLVKGKRGTGKSTVSIYRAMNLENNYCIYPEDNILMVTNDFSKTKEAMNLYKEKWESTSFYSLFSLEEKRLTIKGIDEIIREYSRGYKNTLAISLNYVDRNTSIEILEGFSYQISELRKRSKTMAKCTLGDLLEEINWIKACNFTLEEYLQVERKGRPHRLLRNSFVREGIFSLMSLYNNELVNRGLQDQWDDILFAKKYVEIINESYTHIIIDDCENLRRAEIELVKALYRDEKHSSLIFIVNSELTNEEKAWLVKGRKLKTLGADFKGKTYSFKTVYHKKNSSVINFEYINLKHKSKFDFNIDTASTSKEVFSEDLIYSEEELVDVPVYTEIAAGNPIAINDDLEDTFMLPKQWVGKGNDTFILHVKGDSMIEKNINDGDMVVIKRQNTAYNNDIVAVNLDGEATLKTLKINGKTPILEAANPIYKPITLEDKEVSIIGVAVGVIKAE